MTLWCLQLVKLSQAWQRKRCSKFWRTWAATGAENLREIVVKTKFLTKISAVHGSIWFTFLFPFVLYSLSNTNTNKNKNWTTKYSCSTLRNMLLKFTIYSKSLSVKRLLFFHFNSNLELLELVLVPLCVRTFQQWNIKFFWYCQIALKPCILKVAKFFLPLTSQPV